jgi:hypothetical protein
VSPKRPAWLPTPEQELLLRAAVADDDDAFAAWRRWKTVADPAEPQGTDFQILPLISRRLARWDPEDPHLGRLKGLHRWVWAQNQLLLDLGSEVIADLEREGIETVVLKGGALGLHTYPDLGARPMDDFDVLVRRDAALDAIAAIRRRLEPHEGFPDPERRVPVHHSTAFVDADDRRIDLHWYTLWQSAPEDDLWEAAVPFEVVGVRTKALCPADQLLQICVHGAVWHPIPILRWVPDAVLVLRSRAELDWDRLVDQAVKREVTATLADALGYLRSAFQAPVPEAVLGRLRAVPVSLAERAARRAVTRPLTVMGHLSVHWERYRRLRRLDPGAPKPPSFPAQLKTAWGFKTYREFGRYAARRSLGARR